jgi:hypothetical protein
MDLWQPNAANTQIGPACTKLAKMAWLSFLGKITGLPYCVLYLFSPSGIVTIWHQKYSLARYH